MQIPAATNNPLLNYYLLYGKSCISYYNQIVRTPYIIHECHVLVRTGIIFACGALAASICFGKVIHST